MKPIEFLKNTNTVLVFILLVGTILVGGYLIVKSRNPINSIHVSVDSMSFHKK
ncbi:MAG: hypothetical protein NTX64_01285 [Elusimicrobia bacterium]|nr:hypothetical protein [Elusimicrobiota bacterium]